MAAKITRRTTEDRPKRVGTPLRRLRLERREAEARARGWVGPWPPEKPRIESAGDCERYLTRLEAGEQRAGFLRALASKLALYFEHLQPEHFRRFAIVVVTVAQNMSAAHRSRLRAVQAPIRLLQRVLATLRRLEKAREFSLHAHLATLLTAFCQELSSGDPSGLGRFLTDLTGPAMKTSSDLLRVHSVMQAFLTDTLDILEELGGLQSRWLPDPDMNDPELQRKIEKARQEMAEMMAEIDTDAEEERRTGKPGIAGVPPTPSSAFPS